jgi:predicted amidohydrolase YtcJ
MICLLAAAVSLQSASLSIENARIWSPDRVGFASSAIVAGGRFTYVGDFKPGLISSNTERIDAKGSLVIPGLIDSHIHMLGGGASLSQVQLRLAKDKDDFIRILREYAQANPDLEWITGGRWSTESWADKTEPTKEWLDEAVPDRPVYLSRMDGHSAVASSSALKMGNITKEGPENPEGGTIVRTSSGEPTGILRETAKGLVGRYVRNSSAASAESNLQAAIKHVNSLGITAVSEISSPGAFPLYMGLGEGQTLRFGIYSSTGVRSAARLGSFEGKPGWVEAKGVKIFMDGTLGSRTAYMTEDFVGGPADGPIRGLVMPGFTNGTVDKLADSMAEQGLQLIGHAIGDRANHELINVFDRAFPNVRAARPRLEHAQHMLSADIDRIGELGVIASMQPFHKADDGRYAEEYIGAERSKSSYAYKTILNAGGVLAFGSDWPVVTANPFLGIEAAVTGRTLAGNLWQTSNSITVGEALTAYTSGGAYALGWEDEIGQIAAGFRADFVILNYSLFDPDVVWADVKPTSTYVEGRRVFP